MTVHQQIIETAAREEDRTALVDGASGAAVTYAQLADRIGRVASALSERGFGPGDRLGLWAPNVPPWADVALGAMAAGGAASPIGPLASEREARAALLTAGARLLMTVPAFTDRARAAAAGTAADVVVVDPGLLAGRCVPGAGAHDGDAALLPFSSGTTGPPKAVVLTHANLLAGMTQLGTRLGLGRDDVVLAAAPFAHVMGSLVTLLAPLAAGATVVCMPRFDFAGFLALIERHRVTVTAAPPPVVRALAHHPAVDAHDLSSLEVLACGGAPLAPAVQRAAQRRLPHVTIGQGYGMTETSCAISGPTRASGTRPGCVGRPVDGTEIRIRDGELHVRGPQVMVGYLGAQERTREILDPDGWLRTGDLVEVADDGELRVVGRAKELIKVNGYQVAPAELEAVLAEHPAVDDAAVAAVADEATGEAVVAYVVANGEIDPAALRQWFAEQVAPYKRLRDVRLVGSLPRTPAGKLLRAQLAGESPAVPA